MPFVSEKQRRYCYVLQKKYLSKGEKPLWDCKKFGLDKKSPNKSQKKSQKKSPKVKSPKKSKVKSPKKSKVKSPKKSKVKSPKKSKVKSLRKSPKVKSQMKSLKNNCIISTKNKYLNRPSPPYPAQNCKNEIKVGNDIFIYKSLPDINNIYKWKKI